MLTHLRDTRVASGHGPVVHHGLLLPGKHRATVEQVLHEVEGARARRRHRRGRRAFDQGAQAKPLAKKWSHKASGCITHVEAIMMHADAQNCVAIRIGNGFWDVDTVVWVPGLLAEIHS